MSSDSWLVMSQGPQPGESFTLNQERLTIGRDPSNEIEISDPEVSRQHARITTQAATTVIEDLGSTNGTFVNGMRLTGPHVLTNGDVIGLGDSVTLTFYEGQRVESADTVVGRPPTPPPPAAQPAPPAYQAATPAAAAPPKKGKSWLWIGCLVLVGLAVLACIVFAVLFYFGYLPNSWYDPFRQWGLI